MQTENIEMKLVDLKFELEVQKLENQIQMCQHQIELKNINNKHKLQYISYQIKLLQKDLFILNSQ